MLLDITAQSGTTQIVGHFINFGALVIAFVMLRRSMRMDNEKAMEKKADKTYVDSSDKQLLLMIKDLKGDNNREHDQIRNDIQDKLESMDCKLNLLLDANLKKK